ANIDINVRVCSVCGYTQSKDIAEDPTRDSTKDPAKDPTQPGTDVTEPDTGSESKEPGKGFPFWIIPVIVVVVGAGVAVPLVIILRKRKK
ncbi:MAG: hypothetical protein ACI4EN_10215, partial [Butyrivibrio sp.]